VTCEFHVFSRRKQLGVLCWFAIFAILIATLWPFDFFAANRVSWLPDTAGLRFAGHGVVLGSATLNPAMAGFGDSYSLELLVRPASISSTGYILSIYAAERRSELVVFQRYDRLGISRGFSNALDDERSPELNAYHMFEKGKLLLVTITSGPKGLIVYKNGGQPQIIPEFKIVHGDLAGQIVLGNAAMAFSPFSGEIRGLAIYRKELMPAEVHRDFQNWISGHALDPAELSEAIALYRFSERTGRQIRSAVGSGPDLQIPEDFRVPYKPFLESPADGFVPNWAYLRGAVENILGFAPLGFLLCAYFACARGLRQAILCAILTGGALSFMVEVLQFYVPQRGSGITDVITNGTGAALGALLVRQERTKP
jgi:hypothetical protein